MLTYKHLLLVIIFTFSTASYAADNKQSPNELLNEVANTLFGQIKTANLQGSSKSESMHKIVEQYLMPHIDIKYVSFKLLGKHARKMPKDRINDFFTAVQNHLVGTYANALMNYDDQQVIFDDRASKVNNKYATVKTRIINADKPSIDLQFKLRKSKAGDWKIYDMVAEGISLLSAKQKEISGRITQQGLEQTIVALNQ